jgi:hypothetical protein
MISSSWLCHTLVVAGLLRAIPALAYRPLTGLYENALDAPVVTRSISTSLGHKDSLTESNWDINIVLEQEDTRDGPWVERSSFK